MFTVTVSEKGGQQSAFDFDKPEITIGRMKGNDIVLPKGNVSKRHSRIFLADGGFAIADMGSTNGTYVNGRKITNEQPITDNDKIYIGDFILQVDGEAGAEQKQTAGGMGGPPPAPAGPPMGGDRDMSPSGNGIGGPPPAPGGHPGQQAPDGPGMNPNVNSGMNPLGNQAAAPTGPPPGATGEPVGAASDLTGEDSPGLDFNDIDFNPNVDEALGSSPSGTSSPAGGAGAALQKEAPPAPTATPDPATPARQQIASGFQIGNNDEPTVDRMTDGLSVSPKQQYSQVSAVTPREELKSEFDANFHAAQHDVATVLFESISTTDLPLTYPASPEDRARFLQEVEKAVDTVSPGVDRDRLVHILTNECVALGPLEDYIEDGSVQNIYVNRFDQIIVRRDDSLVQVAEGFSHPQFLMAAAYRLLGPRDVETYADDMRFGDGTRVHVILPPLSPAGPAITIRKPVGSEQSLEDLVESGALSPNMAEFLDRAIDAGRSILIAGPTGSGKSSVLSALATRIPSSVRVVSIENGQNISLPDNSVRLEANASAGYDMSYLLRSAMSMHPRRIIVDEMTGGEAYHWVTSAACGTEGSFATLHGTSAHDALGRLESLSLLGSSDLSPRGLREQIARAVHLVVVVHSTPTGLRIQQVSELQGVDIDSFRVNDVFYFRAEGAGGQFHPTGYVPLFYEDLRHAGVDVDLGIFRE